nr:GTPase IMAP family member 8 isoform X1 [Nothobranchius furzeri]
MIFECIPTEACLFFLCGLGTGLCASHLKIVLLGGRNSGKNSLGNLILAKEEFVTKERTSCSRRLGVVTGRWVTVVDTPGWWCDFTAEDTSPLVKREITASLCLCSPGPHVFLITVKATSFFSERRRRSVEEHVSLLGEGVWSHCIVVFTFADRSEHIEAEEFVQRGGKSLRWLTERCGQRCHSVLLNGDTKRAELLVKIQKLVTDNGNRVFEMQDSIVQAAAEERRRVDERAQIRFIRMKYYRSLMRERLRPVTDIRFVLLGAKGSGKTSALNTILGRESSQQPGRTAQCCVGEGVVFGRQVTVVDTPGWWMNYFCDETSVYDRREIVLSLSLCPPGPHVFLLVIRVDRAFPETYRRSVQEHLELISQHIWSHIILLFSFGDWLGATTTEQYIESEGEALRWLVEKCGNRYHVLNSKTKGDGFQVRELIGKIEEMMSCDIGWHYEIERKELEELERRMKSEAETARERLMKKERQRQKAKCELDELHRLQELRITLVGGRKAGRSSCGNTILSRKCFSTDTQTVSCHEHLCKITGKLVSVTDTPGYSPVTSELLMTPCAILLVVNISSSFTDLHLDALEKQLETGGGQLWSRAMVLFSYGDWLGGTNIEERIESEGHLLQELVERCGNRYHVLDNRNWGDGAQVRELIELVEEMLLGQRMAVRHSSDQMCQNIHSEDATPEKMHMKNKTSCRHQLSTGLTDSSTSCSESSDAAQTVALRVRRTRRQPEFTSLDRNSFKSFAASVRKQEVRWTTDLLVRFPYSLLRPNNDSLTLSRRCQTMLLVPCQSQPSVSSEDDGISLHSLCHPALRERTLQRVCESGGLQDLIDQWGHSSLDELEAFIDSYFDMVWGETMGSFQPPECDHSATEQAALTKEDGGEVLLSIDKKLSKLELLEEIRGELAELRNAIQELKKKNEKGNDNTI